MDNDNFVLSKFLESDSSSEDDLAEKKEPPNHVISEKICELSKLQIKNRLSYRATCEVSKLMNSMPNTVIKLPPRIGRMQLLFENFDYYTLLICDKCDELSDENAKVCGCGQTIKKDSKKNNFLIHFDVRSQIDHILHENFDMIVAYLKREHGDDVMSDIDDGKVFKKIKEENQHLQVLSCTLNIDGAQVFNSSNCSLWPVQLYLNFLPPNIRFFSENIIVSTIYFGRKKPNVTNLLYPLATEFHKFNEKIFTIFKYDEFHNFLPILSHCVCDLPAKAEIQCLKGPTGRYACSYCYHPGIPIKNLSKKTTIRYIKQSSPASLRTHAETLLASTQDSAFQSDKNYGVQGQSALFMFDHIDIIDGLTTDYVHNGLLGVVKDIVEIWIGKRRIPEPNYEDYKIKTTAKRKLLEQRILKLKPNMSFNRKPRSIFKIGNFKAIELQNLLFYYLRYALVGILPTRVVKHFEKLSGGIYILCKKEVKTEEVSLAGKLLIEFADEFEQIYGEGAVTMNVHIFRHYGQICDNCGPLWAYSMYGFENNIGRLKRFVCGTTDVLYQIAHKYSISRNHKNKNLVVKKNGCELYQPTAIRMEQKYNPALENEGEISKIWRRARINGQIFTSLSAIETKSVDYFVKCKNDRMGKIVFFFFKVIQHRSCSCRPTN